MVLYAFGSNGSGQLGIGHVEDVSTPTPHELEFESEPITICAGGNHTLILTKDQKLYLSGAAFETEKSTVSPIAKVTAYTSLFSHNVRLCAATWEASVLVSGLHDVYTYGKGERGELGRNPVNQAPLHMADSPNDQSQQPKIVDVASGVQHTVVVFEDGQVWGWGNGRKGQLGQPAGILTEPRQIADIDFKVVRAVCGREFTFLVGDPHEGRSVVLGSDKWSVVSNAPTSTKNWQDIGACWGSVYVLLESGAVVSWGRNDHGQLHPKSLPPIKELACGSEHCLALTVDDVILAWGWGEHGNCGPLTDQQGDVKDGWAEIKIPERQIDTQVAGISAGCATSWIFTAKSNG